jgi:hypothetical protein
LRTVFEEGEARERKRTDRMTREIVPTAEILVFPTPVGNLTLHRSGEVVESDCPIEDERDGRFLRGIIVAAGLEIATAVAIYCLWLAVRPIF